MRICIFVTTFLPTVGGAERSADIVTRGLIARGHQAMVLAQRTGPKPPALPYPVRSYRRPPRQHFWPELLAWPIMKAYRAWKFDVILAFGSYPAGYAAGWTRRYLKVPVIASPRGDDIQEDFGPTRKVRVARCLARGYQDADRILAISQWTARRVREITGGKHPAIDVVYNGIDLEADAELRAQSRLTPPEMPVKTPFILHLARVSERKQQTVAVRAVHLLREEFRQRGLTYVIAGEGRAMEEVQRLIDELGVGDVVVCVGTRTGVEKAWLYDNALFCVAAALWEGFGHVLIEAMSAGQGILASDTPTHREVLDPHRCAVFFKTGDPADMAAQMLRMLAEAPALRPAAKTAAQHFSIEQMISGYEKCCLAALNDSRIPENSPSGAAPRLSSRLLR